MKKVSVIVPVFNMEKYLKQCLDSILCQTICQDLEIICVNDGSEDNSLYILREYESKNINLYVINQLNSGVGVARNTGISAAKAEFVCFMDPDDYYLNNNGLEKLYNKAKENNVKICGGSFSEDHGTWIRKSWEGRLSKYTFDSEGLMDYKDYQFEYGFHRFIYNREFLLENKIYFPEYIRFQDPPFFVKAMITAKSFYAIPDVTYCYRWGHQKLNWDLRRTSHMLQGLVDDLQLSKENKLYYLNNTSAWRFFCEYKNPIMQNIQYDEIKELIQKAKTYINFDSLIVDASIQLGAKEILGIDLQLTKEN